MSERHVSSSLASWGHAGVALPTRILLCLPFSGFGNRPEEVSCGGWNINLGQTPVQVRGGRGDRHVSTGSSSLSDLATWDLKQAPQCFLVLYISPCAHCKVKDLIQQNDASLIEWISFSQSSKTKNQSKNSNNNSKTDKFNETLRHCSSVQMPYASKCSLFQGLISEVDLVREPKRAENAQR